MHIRQYKTERETKIIKAENNGDEMRQAEQVHDMDAYTRPTLQILVITFWWLTLYILNNSNKNKKYAGLNFTKWNAT